MACPCPEIIIANINVKKIKKKLLLEIVWLTKTEAETVANLVFSMSVTKNSNIIKTNTSVIITSSCLDVPELLEK